MADIPSVIPTAPTSPISGNGTPGLSNAPVQQAPPALIAPSQPVQVPGTVISSNPQAQQLNIQTPQGPVILQSSAPLPPDTQVSVEFFTSNAQTRATVTVMQKNIQQTQTLQNVVQPDIQIIAPTLQEGSTVIALQIQGQSSTQNAQPISIDQLANSIESQMQTGLQNVQPPLPAQIIQELLTTSDLQEFLKQLPPAQLQSLNNSFVNPKPSFTENSPGILRQLLSAYLPQKSDVGAYTLPAKETAQPDFLDNNLLQIMRAQLQAKSTQQILQSPAPGNTKQAAFSPLTSTLGMLAASSTENEKTSGFTALLRQFMPQGPQEQAPMPQNMFRLNILRILLPETTPEQMQSILGKMPAGAQIAELETTTSGGQPILQTGDGHFVVTTPVNVPPGSKIILTAAPMTPDEIMQQGLFTISDSSLLQKALWPALQEALQALPPSSAQAAALRNTLPVPTQQLAPTALFFLAALRSGVISNWLGANTLQVLQQMGKKDLVDSLSSDFEKLSAQTKDVLPGNWRSISIPLRYDEQISQLQFYVRQQHDQDQKEKDQGGGGKPATRFILNLSLSRMGAMQLDGFIQKQNFDIILRTEDKLPFDMRQELMKRFAQGLDQVQMQGSISFQTRQQSWMVPEAGNTQAEI